MSKLKTRLDKLEGANVSMPVPLTVFRRIVAASDGKATGQEWYASAKIVGSQNERITPKPGEADAAFLERVEKNSTEGASK